LKAKRGEMWKGVTCCQGVGKTTLGGGESGSLKGSMKGFNDVRAEEIGGLSLSQHANPKGGARGSLWGEKKGGDRPV